jgi:hypothetical protein
MDRPIGEVGLMHPSLRVLWVLIVALAVAGEARAGGMLIVKYSEAVDACAETTFSRGDSFGSVSPSDSLDALHAQLEVTEIRSLYVRRPHLDSRQARAKWRERMGRAVQRHPRRTARAARSGRLQPERIPDFSRVYRLRYAADLPEQEAAKLYAADPVVEYAHPDHPVQLQHTPDDPYFSTSGSWNQSYDDLWNLKLIGAPNAWDVSMGEGTVIAVVDTGMSAWAKAPSSQWSIPGSIPIIPTWPTTSGRTPARSPATGSMTTSTASSTTLGGGTSSAGMRTRRTPMATEPMSPGSPRPWETTLPGFWGWPLARR